MWCRLLLPLLQTCLLALFKAFLAGDLLECVLVVDEEVAALGVGELY